MNIETVQRLWDTYQDAWADISSEERERLLRATVSEDVAFSNPNSSGQSLDAFLVHVAEFQPNFPGAYFKTNKILTHHDQLLAHWTMFNRDGSEFLAGQSFARVDKQSRLSVLSGFWQL